MEKAYDPKKYEDKIYRMWEESGYFNPDNPPSSASPGQAGERKKYFAVALPPPNITGSLHLGHALNTTIQDILVRKRRMEGYKTLWIGGTDHAGIATQNVVEKELAKEGKTRHDLGKEKFLEQVWAWKEKYGNIILDQLKKMGASLDWTRARFTLDESYRKAVETAFRHYHEKGWLYKDTRVINWCPRCETSLSDLELEHEERKGKLYYIRYPLADDSDETITVATTRPETMLGDSAVAVHPDDARYNKYVGKSVVLPIQNRKIPVIADEEVDRDFGTGAVKVTPAHDLADERIGERHNLPSYQVIGQDGRMTGEAGPLCAGQTVAECRRAVLAELKKQKLLEKEEDYPHNVAICYRCESVVEPLPSLQWFLKMDELAQVALKAVRSGAVVFHPKRFEKVYTDWLENIRDWNVSRQIWWGHKIPLAGEEDVLDTWFSSALWPFATLGWPDQTGDLKTFYPTQVLSTDRGIINLWVARMVFSGFEFLDEKPFSDVIIHPTVLTIEGKRMSKSLGTGVDPLDLIERDGADALRFALVWQSMGTQDMRWDETAVTAGRKFANKLWNIARYVMGVTNGQTRGNIENEELKENTDKEILKKLETTKSEVEKEIEKYEFGPALHTLYDFVWHDLADQYLEATKDRDDSTAKRILAAILVDTLKLLHPFMPFITETIWQKLPASPAGGPQKETDLLMIAKWPKTD